jgi:MipA family protein
MKQPTQPLSLLLSAVASFVLTLGMLVAFGKAAQAEEVEHILEIGAGVAGQYLPEYRGHNEHRLVAIPFPYVGYQGKIIKADEDGIRGEFVKAPRFELNVSGDLALNDGKNDAKRREGMPELGTEFQAGPTINFLLAGNSFKSGLMLRLPVRAAYAFEDDYSSVAAQGFVFNPMLTYVKPNLFDHWHMTFDLGALYATEKYHRYFYTVAPQYATPQRPAYSAKGGFSGTFAELGLSRRDKNLIYSVGLRYDRLHDATFIGSPLVETKNHWVISIAFAYVLKTWTFKEEQ